MSQAFKDALQEVLVKMTPAARRRLITKRVVWRYPIAFETKLLNIFERLLLPAQQLLDEKVQAFFNATKRKDSFESDLENYFQQLESTYAVYVSSAMATASFQIVVDRTIDFLLKYNEQQLERYFEQVLGKKIPYSTDWWSMIKTQLRSKIETTAVSALKDNITDIREFVAKAISESVPYDKIVEGIQKINNKLSTSRARYLARDIAGTYNSLVIRHMGTEILGTDLYKWVTYRDERVRGNPNGLYPKADPSHWIMEQILCRWSDPSTYSTDVGKTWIPRLPKMPKDHPGNPFGCRCNPMPYVAALIKKLVEELNGRAP